MSSDTINRILGCFSSAALAVLPALVAAWALPAARQVVRARTEQAVLIAVVRGDLGNRGCLGCMGDTSLSRWDGAAIAVLEIAGRKHHRVAFQSAQPFQYLTGRQASEKLARPPVLEPGDLVPQPGFPEAVLRKNIVLACPGLKALSENDHTHVGVVGWISVAHPPRMMAGGCGA